MGTITGVNNKLKTNTSANSTVTLSDDGTNQTLTGSLGLLTMVASNLITASPSADHTVSGIKISLTAHEDLAFGDVCYINSDGKAQIVDASGIATSSGIVMCADATITANNAGNFLLFGVARDDTWDWTAGGLIYITITGTTGNTLSQSAPSATDEVVQIVGIATHVDRMIFMPNLVQVELV